MTSKPTSLFFNEEFDLLIRNRQRALYQGKAAAVSTKNDDGPMDILPQHIHFISIIKEFITITKLDGTTQEFPLDMGVLKVYQNQVRIYIGIYSEEGKKK
jgi:F0F1-type ATP synthase epsilon subunit